MKICWLLIIALAILVSAQDQTNARQPRFEDYSVTEIFTAKPVPPLIQTPLEGMYRTRIREGVMKGWGVERDGKEQPGPNFAGHYVIITWGCGSPCLMAAIVDLRTGRVFPPPFHHGPGHSYFQVPWAFPMDPLAYRVDSRLLIANICESDKTVRVEGRVSYEPQRCGTHYFLMSDNGPRLIYKFLEK